MTPEERADRLVNGNYDESMWANFDHVDGYDEQELIRFLADAIREAVKEGREACAQIAESLTIEISGLKRHAQDGHWIGLAIRERNE